MIRKAWNREPESLPGRWRLPGAKQWSSSFQGPRSRNSTYVARLYERTAANSPTLRAMLAKSSSGRCRFRRDGRCSAANHFMRDSHQIALSNIFLLVRESSDPPVDLREFRVTRLVAQVAQAQAQRVAP